MQYVQRFVPRDKNLTEGTLTPYAQTPLNPPKGGCSYCEAVEMGDEMFICFYSSHEGNAKIYTGRVPLKKS